MKEQVKHFDLTRESSEEIDYWAAEIEGAKSIDLDGRVDISNARVTIRDWDELLEVGELDDEGDIYLGQWQACFTRAMKHLCGRTLMLDDSGYYGPWTITSKMCKDIEYPQLQDKHCSKKSASFNVADLESGMLIRDGYGQLAKVNMGTRFGDILIYENGTWNELSELKSHWDKGEYMEYKFTEIYSPESVVDMMYDSWNLDRDYELVWRVEDLEEPEGAVSMSLEDIEEELGYKVKLI